MNRRAENSTSPGVHLVGSIPVDTAGQAFRLAMQYLHDHVKRLPDGEVGERDTWVRWQYARIGASPQLEKLDRENTYVPVPPFGIVDGISSADEIEFPNLGYADAARESWAIFERLVNEGVFPDHVRFQVGLPTPLSVALFYLVPASGLVSPRNAAWEDEIPTPLKTCCASTRNSFRQPDIATIRR